MTGRRHSRPIDARDPPPRRPRTQCGVAARRPFVGHPDSPIRGPPLPKGAGLRRSAVRPRADARPAAADPGERQPIRSPIRRPSGRSPADERRAGVDGGPRHAARGPGRRPRDRRERFRGRGGEGRGCRLPGQRSRVRTLAAGLRRRRAAGAGRARPREGPRGHGACDVVDSSRIGLDSVRGFFHTADGVLPQGEADRQACGCPACTTGEDLAAHNERALFREMLLVRNHLAHGRLRELVERRLANAPWNTAIVRHLDLRGYDLLEPYTPVAGGELLAYSRESLTRPEVVRFRRRVRERYAKPPSARVLLLLPCSARKPYSLSRSHRRFRDAILASKNPSVVHEVIVTSPLGLIPRELERFYPARAYDIPVTGDWSRDEAAMVADDLRAYVGANRYDAVIAHLGAEMPIVREGLPDAIPTSKERPASDESLASLTYALNETTARYERVAKGAQFAEEMGNIARFQFGEPGRALVDGPTFRGRFPDVRIIQGGRQVAMHTGRGMLSLTLDGGAILSKQDAYWVEIEDFLPKGNVFAVGVVDAAREIRPGDEVVVRHAGEVRAAGTARLSWREMVDLRRGEAVHVRHGVAPGP